MCACVYFSEYFRVPCGCQIVVSTFFCSQTSAYRRWRTALLGGRTTLWLRLSKGAAWGGSTQRRASRTWRRTTCSVTLTLIGMSCFIHFHNPPPNLPLCFQESLKSPTSLNCKTSLMFAALAQSAEIQSTRLRKWQYPRQRVQLHLVAWEPAKRRH